MTEKSPSFATELDQTARFGGRIYIWVRLISAVVAAVLCGSASVYLTFFYRRGWTSTSTTIKHMQCDDGTQTTCNSSGRRRKEETCTTRPIHDCTVQLADATFPAMSRRYVTEPPQAGAPVTVYYDPHDRSAASLDASPGARPAGIFLGVLALLMAGGAVFLYKIRNNKDAQRFGAIAGTLDVLSDL